MDLELTGRVAWVTGGSGGIGSAVAAELAGEGCDVALSGRSREPLERTARELAAATGRRVIAVPADVTSTAEIDAAAATIVAELGPIAILANCAGTPGGKANGPLDQLSDQLVLEDLNEKYLGYLRCSRAAVRSMRELGFGRLIHIGGASARASGSYSAGPRNIAVVHLSKTLSDEFGQYGITSNVVHPAVTRTPWVDRMVAAQVKARGGDAAEVEHQMGSGYAVRRLIDATEIAHVIAFLASPKSIGITGESIGAGGGAQRGVTL
jgi:NAD(P)-dependent dehydrogenase (short-subunit alcohol dehydrogenase family)